MLFRSTILALATSLATVSAQYRIDPDSVEKSTREHWCESQKNTCPIICQQMDPPETLVNTCDPETLQYGCLCGNNQKPDISEYTLTLPYFICQEWGNQCVRACNDNACASACREDNPCGAQDPRPPNKTATATAAAKPEASETDDANIIYTNSPGEGNDEGAAPTLEFGRTYGLAIVFGGMFLGFAML